MECPECMEYFDERKYKPKVLPCGHTFCAHCLEKVDRCFLDKKEFTFIPYDLPDNLNVIAMIRSRIKSCRNLHVWCSDCEGVALERCIDESHKTASRKSLLFQQLLQSLHITDGKFDMLYKKHLEELLNNLDEKVAAGANEFMLGKVAEVNVLLQGGNSRWQTSIQLPLAESPEPPRRPPQIDPDMKLDVTNISSYLKQEEYEAEKRDLLVPDRLRKVRELTGLHCNRDQKWSLQLLESVAPFIEEVHLYNFHLEHLEAILNMPELRWLVLEDCLVDMKGNADYVLPPLQHASKVEFLWLSLSSIWGRTAALCKAIIQMFETSIQKLCITLPSNHYDSVEFFDDLQLPSLQLLIYYTYCGDADNCKAVMLGLRKKFTKTKLFCLSCGRPNVD